MYLGEKYQVWLWVFLLTVVTYFALISLTGCSTKQVTESHIINPQAIAKEVTKPPLPLIVDTPAPHDTVKLSWEVNHAERSAWSQILLQDIETHFNSLDKAQDIKRFCPSYTKLLKPLKMQAWAELMIGLSLVESAWVPTSSSQDVGTADDLGSYSDGLFQVSANDIKNYSLKEFPTYTHKDLLTAGPNINLAIALMSHQIDKHGLIVVESRSQVYWITLYESWSNWNDKTENIISYVHKLGFCK